MYDSRLYDVLNFVVCFFVPLAAMSVMYSIIGYQLWRSGVPTYLPSPQRANLELVPLAREGAHSRESLLQSPRDLRRLRPSLKKSNCPSGVATHIHQHYQQQAAATVLRARRKVIRLLVAVVLGFAVCNLPFHARKFYQYWSSRYEGASRSAVMMTILTTLVLYMNSFINPILYAFLSDNFRRSMRDVLLCRSRKKVRRLSSTRSNGKTTASSVFQHQDNMIVHTNGFV